MAPVAGSTKRVSPFSERRSGKDSFITFSLNEDV